MVICPSSVRGIRFLDKKEETGQTENFDALKRAQETTSHSQTAKCLKACFPAHNNSSLIIKTGTDKQAVNTILTYCHSHIKFTVEALSTINQIKINHTHTQQSNHVLTSVSDNVNTLYTLNIKAPQSLCD